eukprot:m.300106 g.300106  ORF g.300106 m.300106 type:complete len:192 (+) comp27244_c3_seq1:71-646(+)
MMGRTAAVKGLESVPRPKKGSGGTCAGGPRARRSAPRAIMVTVGIAAPMGTPMAGQKGANSREPIPISSNFKAESRTLPTDALVKPTVDEQCAEIAATTLASPSHDELPPPSTVKQKVERRKKRRVQLQEWKARQEKGARQARAARRLAPTTTSAVCSGGGGGTAAARMEFSLSVKWDDKVYFLEQCEDIL